MDEAQAREALELIRAAAGADAETRRARLEPARERLAEAAAWLRRRGEADAAAEVAAGAWRVWLLRGEIEAGRAFLTGALGDDGPPSRWRALALYGAGLLAFRAGAMTDSEARTEEALRLAREVGDAEAEALALVGLSRVAFRAGDDERVRRLAGEARERVRAAGLGEAAEAAPLHMLAAGARLSGAYDDAAALYAESLELARRLGDDRTVAMEHHNLGYVELRRGRPEEARRHFREREEKRRVDDPYEGAMDALNAAALAAADGRREEARRRLADAGQELAAHGIVLDPDDQVEFDALRAALADDRPAA